MPIEFPDPSSAAECNTYGYTYDSNCTGSDGVTLDYDQTWHAVVLNGVTAWIPLSGESSTGVDGSDGNQGRQGPTGSAGLRGFQGVTGERGEPGDDATPGGQGDDGAPGNPGVDAVAPGLDFTDINVLETMYVKSIGGTPNDFTVSSTDAFTYDPSNLGALRINRIRENISELDNENQDGAGVITLRGVCGPTLFASSRSTANNNNKIIKIKLDDGGVLGSDFRPWMPGDFVTLIFRQERDGFNSNQFGHAAGENQLVKSSTEVPFNNDEIKYGAGITSCLPFGNAIGDIDVLYVNCINDVGGTIKPYFLVNHLQFHDGLT